MDETWITTAQAAAQRGVSPQNIRALIKKGRFRARKVGHDLWVWAADVEGFVPQRGGAPYGNTNGTGRRPTRPAQ